MAALTAQSPTFSGVTPTVVTPAVAGDTVPVGSILRVTNGTAGAITITLTTHQQVDGNLAVTDRTVSIPASETRYIRATGVYRNADGVVNVASSDTTASVDIEVVM
jgi:hypothetical protein